MPRTPPAILPSAIVPLTTVLRLLRPTVSVFEPRKYVPAPSIEPTVIPPEVSWETSSIPPALVINLALPPVLVSRNSVIPSLLVVIVALPAVLALANTVPPLLLVVIAALPAVPLEKDTSAKSTAPAAGTNPSTFIIVWVGSRNH